MTRGYVVPADHRDVRAAYPAAFSLLDCPGILRARELCEVDAMADLRSLAAMAAEGNFAPLFDPSTYRSQGLCLAEVRYAGEYGPIELPGGAGRPPSFRVAQLRSDVPLPVAWPDAVLGALLSRRSPEILSATRLEPVGTEHTRPLPLRDGHIIGMGDDPVAAGVRLRSMAKDEGDERLSVQLRVFLNAMAWGVSARLDQRRVAGQLIETPAAMTWPPIASTVPAVPRMWLAMVYRAVADAGGTIITRDTDGLAILSSPDGGPIDLADGRILWALSWQQVDQILAGFDALDPFGDGRPFWTAERGTEEQPLHMLSLGQKRYVKAQRGLDGWEPIGGTEHSLGGGVVDPPAMIGRDADRRHLWTLPVAKHALDRADAMAAARIAPRFDAPWDEPGVPPFPVLRQWSAGSPGSLQTLPEALGAHPFAPILEAHPDGLLAAHAETPVTLDPGTDLVEWAALQWHDRHGAVGVTTTRTADGLTVPLQTLRDFAEDWTKPRPIADPGAIVIDHRLIRRVGRGGALIDAQLAGDGANLSEYQVIYDEGDPADFILDEVTRLGPTGFHDRYHVPVDTAKKVGSGRRPSPATIRQVLAALHRAERSRTCALPECDAVVNRSNALYCSATHRQRGYRRRQKAVGSPAPELFADPACPDCGTVLLGAAAHGPCPVCGLGVA